VTITGFAFSVNLAILNGITVSVIRRKIGYLPASAFFLFSSHSALKSFTSWAICLTTVLLFFS